MYHTYGVKLSAVLFWYFKAFMNFDSPSTLYNCNDKLIIHNYNYIDADV